MAHDLRAEEAPEEYERRRNELVVLGSVWTYSRPSVSEDGSETFISRAAEGKRKALGSLLRGAGAGYFRGTVEYQEVYFEGPVSQNVQTSD